jgi:hypothetical protein
LFLLPIGIFTTLTKEMVITDTYFFENNDWLHHLSEC